MLRRLVLFTLVGMLSVPAAAYAAEGDPVLLSVGVEQVGPLHPGDEIAFTYSVDSDSIVEQINVRFIDPVGRTRSKWVDDPTGVVRFPIGEYWAAGLYELDQVSISSQDGYSVYDQDGTVHHGGFTENEIHSVDFSDADLTIANPNEDITVPVLSAFSSQPLDNVAPGDVIRFEYAIEEDDSGLDGIFVSVQDVNGRDRSAIDPDLDGVIAFKVGRYWTSGAYKVNGLSAWDVADNYVSYAVDGTVLKWPYGTNGPTEHAVDFNSFGFSIDNPEADSVPPVLTSFALDGGSVLAPGDQLDISYEVEEQSGISQVTFWFYGPGGSLSATDNDGDGVATAQLGPTQQEGLYRLSSVHLYDLADNSASYYSGGNLYTYPSTGNGSQSHAFDFDAADLRVIKFEGVYEDALGRGSIKVDFGLGFFELTLGGETLPLSQGTLQVGSTNAPFVLVRDDTEFPIAGTFARGGGIFTVHGVWNGTPFSLVSGP